MKHDTHLAKWLREQGRGSLLRLSQTTGLSPGHIHNIKSGSVPKADAAKRLEEATGIPAVVFMGLEDAK